MVQELDQYSSLADLTTQDPMADWIEYNAKEMPYDFKDMVNASFEQAYYYGPFAKAYQYYRRTTDTEPTFSPEVLNKKFNTDAFKVPMSASLADDFIAMNNRRLELDAIVNQGTGSIWTDTAPWLAGQFGGGIVDPINLGAGALGGAVAAPIRGAIARLGTEALIGGTIPAYAYQVLAPEQGEERSLSAFAQDVVLGAVIEMGAHGIAVGGKKALSAGYNKMKARGVEAAAKVQSYAEKAFADGKKIDVDQVIDGDTPPIQPASGAPSPTTSNELKFAYAPINAKGDIVSIGDSLVDELVAHNSISEAKNHGGRVQIYDYSSAKVATDENLLEAVQSVFKNNKYEAEDAKVLASVAAFLENSNDATIKANLPDLLRSIAPQLYSNVVKELKGKFDVLEYGQGKRVILNETNLKKYEGTPSVVPQDKVRIDNKINHVDIDHSEGAFNEVPLIDDKFEAMKKVDSSLEEGEIQTLVGQLETNENMIPSVKKELEDLKKSGIMFKRLSKVYETFSNCIIGGGK